MLSLLFLYEFAILYISAYVLGYFCLSQIDLCRYSSISVLNRATTKKQLQYVQQSYNYSVDGMGNISHVSMLKINP